MSYKLFGIILVDLGLVNSNSFEDILPTINEIGSYTAGSVTNTTPNFVISNSNILDNFAVVGELLLSALKELHIQPTNVTPSLVNSFDSFLGTSELEIKKQGVVETLINCYFTRVSKDRLVFNDLKSHICLIDSIILNCKSYNTGLYAVPYKEYDNLSRFKFVKFLELHNISDLDIEVRIPIKINPLVSYGYNIIRDYAEAMHGDLPYYRELGLYSKFNEQTLTEFACCGLTKLQSGSVDVSAVFSRLSNPQFWHAMGIVEGN